MADDMVVIEIDGKKYSVTKAMAEQIEAERQKRKDKEEATIKELSELKRTVSELQQSSQRATQSDQPPEKEGLDYKRLSDQIWEDPEKVIRELENGITKKLVTRYEEEQRKSAEQAESERLLKQFYDDFFVKNKHLADDRDLVEAILTANYPAWKTLSRDDLMEALEKKATEVILRHSQRENREEPENEEPSGQDFPVEGQSLISSESDAEKGKGNESDEGKEDHPSMTQVLKARKMARRQAAGKTK